MRRRTVLASVAALPAVAGCLSTDSDDGSANAGSSEDGATDGAADGVADGGATDAGQSIDDGNGIDGETPAALASIDGLPTLGEPSSSDRVIVAFEDPACPTCGQFHESDLPDVRSELVDDGYASLVWRPYRYVSQVYPWNSQAIHAVLEAESQSTDAGWELLDFYYGDQDAFSSGTVAEDTRTFVESSSLSIDADAVVDAMETSAHQSLLAESESVGEEASVTSTPTFLLFEGTEYLTSRHGSTSVTEFRAGFEA